MIQVLLDANAVGIDPPLGKIEHRVLLDAHRSGGVALVVPQLALREAVSAWKREVTSQLGKLHSTRQKLAKFAPSYSVNVPAFDLDHAADDLLTELSQVLETARVEMPGTPSADHEELIDRAINRRQPFDRNGSGYRDALLWQIAREYADKGNEVLLVSNDPAAFAQGRKGGMPLAPSLAEEIKNGGSVRLASGTKAAIADLGLVAPEALAATQAVIERLGDSFGEQLLDRLGTELIHPVHVWVTRSVINPFIASDASLGVAHKFLRATVEEARIGENGLLEATVLLEVGQWLRIYVPAPASKQFEGIGMIQAVDEHFDAVELDGVVEHRCSVLLDPISDRLVNAEALEAVAASPGE